MKSGEQQLDRQLILAKNKLLPQLAQLPTVNISKPCNQLECWDYWIAAEIMEQWRSLSTAHESSITKVLERLGLSSTQHNNQFFSYLDKADIETEIATLTQKLVLKLDSLQAQQKEINQRDFLQWLEQEEENLQKWFDLLSPVLPKQIQSTTFDTGCLSQLQQNAQLLHSKILKLLQDCFEQEQQQSIQSLSILLNSLVKALEDVYTNYYIQRQKYIKKEKAALQAYYNLKTRLVKNHWWFFDKKSDTLGLLRALKTAYEHKLTAEIYGYAAQIVSELVQHLNGYSAAIAQTDSFLEEIQKNLMLYGTVEVLFVPVLKEAVKQVDTLQLRNELEHTVGVGFEYWGDLDLAGSTLLCEQLLLKARSLRVEIYSECRYYLLSPALSEVSSQEHLAEKTWSLNWQNADIRACIEELGQTTGLKLIADATVAGKISLSLASCTATEAIEAIREAGKLAYTKKEDSYVFTNPTLEKVNVDQQAVSNWFESFNEHKD